MMSAGSSPSGVIQRLRRWPTWACMPCSIAGRSRRESPHRMASGFFCTRTWAWWPIFSTMKRWRAYGRLAIGHTRYSTTGDSALLNAQPIRVECNKGRIALAHNGNLVNAADIRKRFERQGSIFQTTSDSEIICT